MKIFHTADLHYSSQNLEEADRCFGFAIEEAAGEGVELAVIAGDTTNCRLEAHAQSLLALAFRLRQLANLCPVLLLQGTISHEPTGMLQLLGLIGAKHPIYVADTIGMVALKDGHLVPYQPGDTPDGVRAVITCAPTVNKAELAITAGVANTGQAMGDYLLQRLSSYASTNAQLRALGIPTILAGHGTVGGAITEVGTPMLGQDHEFSLGTLYAANTTATMLGHIHCHQVWSRQANGTQQVVAYSGSIGRFHYGELGEKGYLMWDVQAQTASIEHRATPACRMIDVVFPGAPEQDKLLEVASQCAGAFVRVRYTIDEEFADTVDCKAIRAILCDAADLQIERTVLPIERQRCAGISTKPTLEAKLLQWAEHTNTPTDGLLECLHHMQEHDAADIANDLITTIRAVTTSEEAPQ